MVIPLLTIFVACQPAGFLFTGDGAIECGGDGEAIKLANNPDAVDPTFDELIAFIKQDITDKKEYIADGPGAYVCADFAEEVHNNAEAAGLRAGWAGIIFAETEEGHAVNAFETVDRGLVFIDCTNGSKSYTGDNGPGNWDAVAYVQEGSRYGIIPIDRAESLEYSYYLEYESAWRDYKNALEDYNREVDAYNREIEGRVYTIGSPEERSITARGSELAGREELLKDLENELGNYWYTTEFSSYSIKGVEIHW